MLERKEMKISMISPSKKEILNALNSKISINKKKELKHSKESLRKENQPQHQELVELKERRRLLLKLLPRVKERNQLLVLK